MNKKKSNAKALGIFALAMINVAAVLSLRNFPAMAEYGWSSIGWYVIGTITFLIPLTLASAELATGWPKGGGVYAWVKEAFGDQSGFIAIFCDWSNNLVWFPTVLAFIASTFAFALNPSLASNGLYMFVVMMIAFWGTTFLALLGSKGSSRFQSFGVIAGTIIPGSLIIVTGGLVPALRQADPTAAVYAGCHDTRDEYQNTSLHFDNSADVRGHGDGRLPCPGST